jgi:hypothetical protein
MTVRKINGGRAYFTRAGLFLMAFTTLSEWRAFDIRARAWFLSLSTHRVYRAEEQPVKYLFKYRSLVVFGISFGFGARPAKGWGKIKSYALTEL